MRAAPELPIDGHKGLAGRVLCLCGSESMPGAAVLVARAAQRAGAGLVSIATDSATVRQALPAAAPEALLATFETAAQFRELLKRRQDHARLAGPGLGASRATRERVIELVESTRDAALVLDADALNVLAGNWRILRSARTQLVLTPHPGEAERLLGRSFGADDRSRLAAARSISEQSGAICCLKGRATVVASGERVYVNATGNPGLATAGTGDVLAGILVAYLAACRTGIDPSWSAWDAACAAIHVHGLAGDLARGRVGTRGLIASDLVTFLPQADERMRAGSRLD